MKSAARWAIASLITILAFSVVTLISGAVALPSMMKDAPTRWGVAVGLGTAVAALAAMWGQSFAASRQPDDEALGRERSSIPSRIDVNAPTSTRNTISGGTFYGPVIQGKDNFVQPSGGHPQRPNPHPDDE